MPRRPMRKIIVSIHSGRTGTGAGAVAPLVYQCLRTSGTVAAFGVVALMANGAESV
jgi:hypothetical protein